MRSSSRRSNSSSACIRPSSWERTTASSASRLRAASASAAWRASSSRRRRSSSSACLRRSSVSLASSSNFFSSSSSYCFCLRVWAAFFAATERLCLSWNTLATIGVNALPSRVSSPSQARIMATSSSLSSESAPFGSLIFKSSVTTSIRRSLSRLCSSASSRRFMEKDLPGQRLVRPRSGRPVWPSASTMARRPKETDNQRLP